MNRMPIRRTAIAATLATALVAATGSAVAGNRHHDDSLVRARVVAAEPVYETINEPRTQCWSETVGYAPRYRDSHREGSGGAVLGAIAGGLIGSTVGNGNGRVAAAAVGAATGAVIGDRAQRHDRYVEAPRQVERCETTDRYRRVISGYDVRYRYQGREYSTHLPDDPGKFITLRVTVAVANEQDYRHDD